MRINSRQQNLVKKCLLEKCLVKKYIYFWSKKCFVWIQFLVKKKLSWGKYKKKFGKRNISPKKWPNFFSGSNILFVLIKNLYLKKILVQKFSSLKIWVPKIFGPYKFLVGKIFCPNIFEFLSEKKFGSKNFLIQKHSLVKKNWSK